MIQVKYTGKTSPLLTFPILIQTIFAGLSYSSRPLTDRYFSVGYLKNIYSLYIEMRKKTLSMCLMQEKALVSPAIYIHHSRFVLQWSANCSS